LITAKHTPISRSVSENGGSYTTTDTGFAIFMPKLIKMANLTGLNPIWRRSV